MAYGKIKKDRTLVEEKARDRGNKGCSEEGKGKKEEGNRERITDIRMTQAACLELPRRNSSDTNLYFCL